MKSLSRSVILLAALALITFVVLRSPTQPISFSSSATGHAGIYVSPLDAWTLVDLRDSSLPDRMRQGANGYHLDKAWEVESIGYLYQWWGLGTPVMDYQIVEQGNGSYVKNRTDNISSDAVQSLIGALDNLHLTQMSLAGNGWTDDYPAWTVEITGTDGQWLLIYSSSTGNIGSAPWNVYYNGRLYAQYDGSLAGSLNSLFTSEQGSPSTAFLPGDHEDELVYFGTVGLPPQMWNGFVGLLPIADSFQYAIDSEASKIVGHITGRSSIAGIGHMIIGTIGSLYQVQLELQEGTVVPCAIESIQTDDPAGAAWQFTCTVGNRAGEGAPFDYPITVDFATDQGEIIKTQGRLFGRWGEQPDYYVLPASDEMQNALADYKPASDLLRDHVLGPVQYTGAISSTGPLQGTITGEAILLGQRNRSGHPLRYTVGTEFAIQDGKMVEWDLTRDALNNMLDKIINHPLTDRVLAADSDTTLNMWYAEAGHQVEPVTGYLLDGSRPYTVVLEACGSVPAKTLPAPNEPLIAFGFNSNWVFWQVDFVMASDQAFVADLDLFPTQNDRGPILPVLMPKAFNTGENRPFQRIWMQSGSEYSGQPRELTLWIPEDVTPTELEVYQSIANSLPAPVDQEYDTLWSARNLAFVVSLDGKIDVAACKPR